MTIIRDFKLPDLGEGLTESELVSWNVAVGDTVALNQVIAEVETAKALVELPSPFAGTVARLYAESGDTVNVGEPLVAFEVDGDGAGSASGGGASAVVADAASAVLSGSSASASASSASASVRPDDAAAAPTPTPTADPEAPPPNLVGYGAKSERAGHPVRRPRHGIGAAESAAPGPETTDPDRRESVAASDAPADDPRPERPRSTPPVRRLALDLGVDIEAVAGSGEHGLVTRADVETAAAGAADRSGDASPLTGPATPGVRREDIRIPIAGVRKRTAEAMVRSAFTAPTATVFLTVDVTPTLELLDRLRASPAFADRRLTMLTIVAKAVCLAVARVPSVNASWDEDAGEIVQYGAVHLGIAAATPRGLMVPVVRDADALRLDALADGIAEVVESAKSGRIAPERLTGSTISITNVGVFGVDAGTPILNPGEAAILAMGAIRRQPWEHRDELALRQVMTLCVSFDHRLVDGEQGATFLAAVGAILADPGSVLTMV